MNTRKIHFETLGCKLNQVESEGAARFFSDWNFEVTMSPLTASSPEDRSVALCVVNTCTVTAKAEQKARRIIRMLLKICPCCAVAVTGCYAQLNQKDILAIDSRVCVLGGQHKGAMADVPKILSENPLADGNEIASRLQKFFDGKNSSSLKDIITEPFRLSTDTFINHSRSSLKIQDGCNSVCTYCRIRLARGKSVSIDAFSAVERVRELERAGQNEVVITTVNIAQYFGELDEEKFNSNNLKTDENIHVFEKNMISTSSFSDDKNTFGQSFDKADGFDKLKQHTFGKKKFIKFAGLLSLILGNTEKIGVRISSLYPEIVDEELCKIIRNPRLRPHFHISVQSGSDAVLARMKRPYRIEAVYKACRLLKEAKGNPFLACDIIAGFPGESDEDFEETMKMLGSCGFTFVHAFPFSPRPGTEAFKMRPMVPNYITDSRIKRLEEFNRKSKSSYIKSFEGKILPAVCETVHRAHLVKDRVIVHAVTENFLHCQLVFSPEEKNLPEAGSVVSVRVIRPLEESEKTGESDTLVELCGIKN